jgi:hypothetical protein
VAAVCGDAILKGVVANATYAENSSTACAWGGVHCGGSLSASKAIVAATGGTVDYKVGVIDCLAQADEQVEDVSVVVENRAAVNIPARWQEPLSLSLCCFMTQPRPHIPSSWEKP